MMGGQWALPVHRWSNSTTKVLAYLDVPTLGQPEIFIQVHDGFFDRNGNFANSETKSFLQGWMDRYVSWVKQHTNVKRP